MAMLSFDQILGLGKVTNQYGTSNSRYQSGKHTGLDIVLGSQSKTVPAFTSGTVEKVVTGQNGSKKGYGNYIVVKDENDNYILYGHLDSIAPGVKEGAKIDVGKTLGVMGSTGNSTGPHLHVEVRKGKNSQSAAINPGMYFETNGGTWADQAATVGPTTADIAAWWNDSSKMLIVRLALILIGIFLFLSVLRTSLLGG